MFSRYWLTGRRRGGRRDGERTGIYVDRYTAAEWTQALGLLAFSIADMILTLIYIEQGGEEANPIMAAALAMGTPVFVVAKVGLTALGSLFLLTHIRFVWVRRALWMLLGLYLALLGYHVWLRAQL